MTYSIWTISRIGGDRKELVAEYNNKGQALARVRGLYRNNPEQFYKVEVTK